MKICEVWLALKEVKALLPVASLWASLDYKSVANWPIMVSRILLLTKLISEINSEIRFQESSLLGKDTSYDISLKRCLIYSRDYSVFKFRLKALTHLNGLGYATTKCLSMYQTIYHY
jgi:hypothetical protein